MLEKLIKYIDELLDYCMSMRTATGYKPKNSPNLEMILRDVNKIKEDKGEI